MKGVELQNIRVAPAGISIKGHSKTGELLARRYISITFRLLIGLFGG